MSADRRGVFVVALPLVIAIHFATEALGQKASATEAADTTMKKDYRAVHTSEEFTFLANARLGALFPLFGADRERVWATGWEPRFVWPAPPFDRAGMVFQISHGEKIATWVNTVFDPVGGRVQYVYVVPEVVATVITLHLRARGTVTEVAVRYERTSLSAESDVTVKEMAEHDRVAGLEWARQINAFIAGRGTH